MNVVTDLVKESAVANFRTVAMTQKRGTASFFQKLVTICHSTIYCILGGCNPYFYCCKNLSIKIMLYSLPHVSELSGILLFIYLLSETWLLMDSRWVRAIAYDSYTETTHRTS
jgi:hypothetical protein